MISLTKIHKKYGSLKILNGIDLEFKSHGVHSILGPNGSGKTTLIKIILGMVIPQQGEILIDNEIVNGEWEYRDQISYLPQIARFPDNITVSELLNMVIRIRGRANRSDELIDLFKLEPFLKKKLGNLSGGTRQKVNLVLAFMFDTGIIILDEPTTGLDPVALIKLKELIRKERLKGKTILITTHIMSFVEEMADDIVFLLDGKIHFVGSTDELRKENQSHSLEHAIANVLEAEHA
ncbi:ABC transporter ATP-binding protein [Balneola sp. MJW-20]|uniref:ABC transporter ATP-binding protein n=1 Tax=Gracilimonas aurantiaca TaxID=3234185 RepID=UPI003464F07D